MVHRGVSPEPSGGAAADVADARAPARARTARAASRPSAAGGCSAVWVLIAIALGRRRAPARASRSATSSRSRAPTRRRRSTCSTSGSRRRTSRPRRSCSTTRRARCPTRDASTAAAAAIEKLPQVESVVDAAGLGQRPDGAADRHLRRGARRHLDSTRSTGSSSATAAGARRGPRPWRTAARSIDFVQQQTAPQNHADEIGLLAAVIILLFVFGTVVAAFLPLIVALTGVDDRDPDPHDHRDRRHRRHRRPDPRHDDRARRRHRLLAAHRQPVPPGARRGPRGPRRDRRRDRHRRLRVAVRRACASRSRSAGSGSPASRTSRRSASPPRCSSA